MKSTLCLCSDKNTLPLSEQVRYQRCRSVCLPRAWRTLYYHLCAIVDCLNHLHLSIINRHWHEDLIIDSHEPTWRIVSDHFWLIVRINQWNQTWWHITQFLELTPYRFINID